MWFPNEIWGIIKSYQINYQLAWHKKIKNIIKGLPKLFEPTTGPRIIYYNLNHDFQFVKYLYHIRPFKDKLNKTVIVHSPYHHQYSVNRNINEKIIFDEYWSYINKPNPY